MTKNEVKYFANLKKKEFRSSEDMFIIEGTHLIEECISSKFYVNNIIRVLIRKDYENKLLSRLKAAGFIPELLTENEFNKISEIKTPQGIIAIVKKLPITDVIKPDYKLAIGLDNINDPGNFGTTLRTCWWYGVDKVYVSSNSVDLFNPKVIRGSQGAVFNLDITTDIDLNRILDYLIMKGWKSYATDLRAFNYINEIDFTKNKKNIFIFGNEANGISEEILVNSNCEKIKIKGFSNCESLNVGISAGIVLDNIRNKR